MTHTRILPCLFFGLMFLTACSKDKPPAASSTDNNVSTPPVAESQPAPAITPAPPPTPPPLPPKPVVIPAGTMLTVRLQDALSSKTSNEGDRFHASLARSIRVDEKTVA